MESIIKDAVVKHMTDNNLFSKYQFGFISGRSTVLQLLHVLERSFIVTRIVDAQNPFFYYSEELKNYIEQETTPRLILLTAHVSINFCFWYCAR